jgi:hypothetical protein
MFGLPDYAVAAFGVAIVVLGVAAVRFLRPRALAFRLTYGVFPESGTKETVAAVVREVLAAMLRSLNRLKERLALYEEQARQGASPEEALQLNQEADELQRAIEKLNRRLSKAAKLAVRFGFADTVSAVGLEQYLSPKSAGS